MDKYAILSRLQKMYEDAKMYFIKAYELEKTSDTENMLGYCYFELGNYEQANGIFKHLLEKEPLNITSCICIILEI